MYCVRELGVHVSSNPPQKGFQQVSDEANEITDPSGSSRAGGSDEEEFQVLCKLMGMGCCTTGPFDSWFN